MPMIPVDTAVQIMVGPLIDDTDGVSRETGVVYNAAGMDVDLLKSSDTGVPTTTAITLTTGGTNDWIELSGGYYYIELTAAQNNTEGKLKLIGIATGIMHFESIEYDVVPTTVYNSLVAGTDTLPVDVTQALGSAVSATSGVMAVNTTQIEGSDATDQINAACDTAMTDYGALQPTTAGRTLDVTLTGEAGVDFANIAGTLDAANIGTDAIGAAELAADAVEEIRAAVLNSVVEDDGPSASNIVLSNAIAYILAYAAGQATGQATTAPIFKSPGGAENRITATTDGSGNRSSIALIAPT